MARCHHGLCSGIVNIPLPNIKLYWHLVPTGSFLLFGFPMISGTRTQKNFDEIPAERNCQPFFRGRQYEQFEGQEGRWLSATKMNSEELTAGGGVCGWIRNSPKSARLCFHFWLWNRGKVGEVVNVGIILPLLLILNFNFSATTMNFEKRPEGGGARSWIRNSPESVCLSFNCRPINWVKGGEVNSKWVFFFHYSFFFKSPQQKWISKKHRQEMERVAE